MLIQNLAENREGRDFVVGDIHFKANELHTALNALDFNATVDRLVCVGDLIDRGPGVLEGLRLLGEPWFHCVRGNHEQMLIDAYRQDPNARYRANGASWWSSIADESKLMIVERLERLPLVIEIESSKGVVGIVHADIPPSLSWQEFTGGLDDPNYQEWALWGRDRIKRAEDAGVKGIWRVCVGHTLVSRPMQLGNVLALDCTAGGPGPLAIYCVQTDTTHWQAQ